MSEGQGEADVGFGSELEGLKVQLSSWDLIQWVK